jgi:hypothetical protein
VSIPIFFCFLGGGLPVGSVILVGRWYALVVFIQLSVSYCPLVPLPPSSSEEDAFGQYSRLLLKYFLAEGVMCGHSLLLGSASEDFSVILKVKVIAFN